MIYFLNRMTLMQNNSLYEKQHIQVTFELALFDGRIKIGDERPKIGDGFVASIEKK